MLQNTGGAAQLGWAVRAFHLYDDTFCNSNSVLKPDIVASSSYVSGRGPEHIVQNRSAKLKAEEQNKYWESSVSGTLGEGDAWLAFDFGAKLPPPQVRCMRLWQVA